MTTPQPVTQQPGYLGAIMISADSHVQEPDDLWKDLPPSILSRLGLHKMPSQSNRPKGAGNARARVADQDLDGVTAELLFPDNGLAIFGADQDVQEAAFRVYNDWLADFCKAAATRLFGFPALCVWDMQKCQSELRRAHDMGLVGAMIWECPHPSLPFTSDHYEPLWGMAAEMGVAVNLHILTGHNYSSNLGKTLGIERIRGAVNHKLNDAVNQLFDLIFSGVFDRHPKLRVVLAESEFGWLPYVLQQWDYYFDRYTRAMGMSFPIKRKPSEIFDQHVYGTFIEDRSGAHALAWFGTKNCMWSSDYPHPNMTWPRSREKVDELFGKMSASSLKQFLHQNVIELYKLKI